MSDQTSLARRIELLHQNLAGEQGLRGWSWARLWRKLRFLFAHTATLVWVVILMLRAYAWPLFKWSVLEIPVPRESIARINRANAIRYREAAFELKGGLIKVGQFVGSRVDIVPREYVEELSALQDAVEPEPYAYIAGQIRHVYGAEPEQVFVEFDQEPLAAASFGQVHRAVTEEGDEVAVKVQYPHIRESLAVDLAVFWVVVKLLHWLFPRLHLADIYTETAKASWNELDYLAEADYAERIHDNFADDPRVVVPRPHRRYCAKTVLVTDLLVGHKISDVTKMAELGIDPRDVAVIVIDAYIKQIYVDGFFQSDPHAGNLFFLPPEEGGAEGVRVGIVDFGQSKEMPRDVHENLRRAVFGVLMKDDQLLIESMVALRIIGPSDRHLVSELIEQFAGRIETGSPEEFNQLDYEELRETFWSFLSRVDDLKIPNDLILYGRTLSLLHGLATTLHEGINVFEIARHHFVTFLFPDSQEP